MINMEVYLTRVKGLSCQQSTGSLRSARSPEGEQHK